MKDLCLLYAGFRVETCVFMFIRYFIGIFTGVCLVGWTVRNLLFGIFVGVGNLHNGRVGVGLWWDCPSHCSRGKVQFVSRIFEK